MYLHLSYYYIHSYLHTYIIFDVIMSVQYKILKLLFMYQVLRINQSIISVRIIILLVTMVIFLILWSPRYLEMQVEFGHLSEKVLSSKLSTSLDVEPCFWNWHHHLGKTEVVWQKLQNCTGNLSSLVWRHLFLSELW